MIIRLNIIILILFLISEKLKSQVGLKQLGDITKEYCNQCLNYIDVETYYKCLKYFINNEKPSKALKLINNSYYNNRDKAYYNDQLKYQTNKLEFEFTAKYREHKLNTIISNKLLNQVLSNPDLLESDLNRLNNPKDLENLDLHDFIVNYGFYLFANVNKGNIKCQKIDYLFLTIIQEQINLFTLKSELEKFENYTFQIGDGVSIVKKKFFNKTLTYNIDLDNLQNFENEFKQDTVTIFDYYPLNQYKEPVFIEKKLKSNSTIDSLNKKNLFLDNKLYYILSYYG